MADAKSIPEWWMPAAWPLFWRRAFIVTLPISGPVWLALAAIGGLLTMVSFFCFVPFYFAFQIKVRLWDRQPGETN